MYYYSGRKRLGRYHCKSLHISGRYNINILDISQTIVDGYFNMMAVVDVENSKKELDIVSVDLRDLGLQIGVDIHCQREEIFQRMHRL